MSYGNPIIFCYSCAKEHELSVHSPCVQKKPQPAQDNQEAAEQAAEKEAVKAVHRAENRGTIELFSERLEELKAARAQLAKAEEVIRAIVKSEVVNSAPFAGYSEAIANARAYFVKSHSPDHSETETH